MNPKLHVLFPFLIIFAVGEKLSLESTDKSKWIDPNDMLNFDHVSNRMRSSSGEEKHAKNTRDDDEESTKLRIDLIECRRNLLEQAANLEKQRCPSSISASSSKSPELIIFKHLLLKISAKFGIDLRRTYDDDDELYFDVKLQMSKSQIQKWSKLVTADDSPVDINLLQDVTESFAALFSRTKRRWEPSAPFKEETWIELFQKYLPVFNLILLIPIVCFYFIHFLKLSKFTLVSLFISSVFVASTIWTWIHLYQIKQAEKFARLFQTIPEPCRPKGSVPMYKMFALWMKSFVVFSEPDECTKYQKDILADPFWEVTPMQAISLTFVKFFFEPLEIIAQNFSRFLSALLKDLPLTVQPIALVFVLLFILLMLIFGLYFLFSAFGYRMTALYGLIAIEPSRRFHLGSQHASASAPAIAAPAALPVQAVDGDT